MRGLAFDPATGKLYATDMASDKLITIDPITGAAASVGPTRFPHVTGLAFIPVPPPICGGGSPFVPNTNRIDADGNRVGNTIDQTRNNALAVPNCADGICGTATGLTLPWMLLSLGWLRSRRRSR